MSGSFLQGSHAPRSAPGSVQEGPLQENKGSAASKQRISTCTCFLSIQYNTILPTGLKPASALASEPCSAHEGVVVIVHSFFLR
jgi:hypothetical protein